MPLTAQDQHNARDPRQPVAWAAITPSDSHLSRVPAFISVGVAGTLVIAGADGVGVTFTAAPGVMYPLSPVVIKAASTATGIVAHYTVD